MRNFGVILIVLMSGCSDSAHQAVEILSDSSTIDAAVKEESTEQEVLIDDDSIFTWVDQMPEFQGGKVGLENYLRQKNPDYVDSNANNGSWNVVYVSFIVERDGSITNILTSLNPSGHKELAAKAEQIVREMPGWEVGRKNGQIVRVRMLLPIRFKIGNN